MNPESGGLALVYTQRGPTEAQSLPVSPSSPWVSSWLGLPSLGRPTVPACLGLRGSQDLRISVVTLGQSQECQYESLPLCIPQILCDSVSLRKEKQTQEGQGHVSMQPGGSVTDISQGGFLGTEITIVLCCPPPWHPQFK